jgi:hypothetical protein
MKGIIDRFEGEVAIVELDNRDRVEISRKLISETAKEGDVLVQCDGKFVIDQQETLRRNEEIETLSRDLWE